MMHTYEYTGLSIQQATRPDDLAKAPDMPAPWKILRDQGYAWFCLPGGVWKCDYYCFRRDDGALLPGDDPGVQAWISQQNRGTTASQ